MDNLTIERIRFLHPKIRQEVLEAYHFCNKVLLGKNVRLRFSHTLRTFDEQKLLYALGRTNTTDPSGNKISKVTNADAGQSMHNYGLAFDIVLLLDNDKNGTFETASWDVLSDDDKDSIADWTEVVNHFKNLGYTWGGNWKSFPDYPHFEKTFGHTWKSLLTQHDAGNVFTEVIDGKTFKWVNL